MSDTNYIDADRTWCTKKDCVAIHCFRHPGRMLNPSGCHSIAVFEGTPECPLYPREDSCIDTCRHARYFFFRPRDPKEALKELQEKVCATCPFEDDEED